MAGEFEDIRRRLQEIAEELADLAIERLRESIDAGGRRAARRRAPADPGPPGGREGRRHPGRTRRPRPGSDRPAISLEP